MVWRDLRSPAYPLHLVTAEASLSLSLSRHHLSYLRTGSEGKARGTLGLYRHFQNSSFREELGWWGED